MSMKVEREGKVNTRDREGLWVRLYRPILWVFLLVVLSILPMSYSPKRAVLEGMSFDGNDNSIPGFDSASQFSQVEGYYKDLFMDSGYALSSTKTLPAAAALELSMEVVAVGSTDSGKATQNRLLVSDPGVDDNGILLYPDGSPRFRMIFVRGGNSRDHGASLGETGRNRFRTYFRNGGSYSGACAGMKITSLHWSHWVYIKGPDGEMGTNDDYTPDSRYLHIWPGTTDSTDFGGVSPDLQAIPGMEDHPFWQQFPSLQDGWVENCYFNGGPPIIRDDTGDLDEMAKTEFLARYIIPDQPNMHQNAGLIAYKRDAQSGRLVVIGCHPEGVESGERLDLMKAMFLYALEGAGEPRAKAELSSGEARTMDDNGSEGFEKIGDKQYHHFKVEIPEGTTYLEVDLDGESGFDLDLYLQQGDFAFRKQADHSSTSSGDDERIVVADPSPGTWYIGVKLYTTVTYNAGDYEHFYTGKTGVLNGVPYTILANWGDEPATFADVPYDHPYHDPIEALYQAGYTAGCETDPLRYCPEATMIRAESAVFVERGIHSTDFEPETPETPSFNDVPNDYWGAGWIEGLWQDGYTAGCGVDPLIYCPLQEHTRAEGCVFYMRMLHGIDYEPPEPEGVFVDVPVDWWGAGWVEAAYQAGLIEPCETDPSMRFCPEDPLTRSLAAYMMVQAKELTLP